MMIQYLYVCKCIYIAIRLFIIKLWLLYDPTSVVKKTEKNCLLKWKKSPNRVSNGLCKHWINCYALDWCGLIEQYFRINHRLHGCNGAVPSITWWKASNQWTLTSAQRTILISFRHYVEKCCLKMIKDSILCQLPNDDIFIVNITVGAVIFLLSSLRRFAKASRIILLNMSKLRNENWMTECIATVLHLEGCVCVMEGTRDLSWIIYVSKSMKYNNSIWQ